MSLFSLTGSVVLHIDSYASYLLSTDLHIKLSLLSSTAGREMDAGTGACPEGKVSYLTGKKATDWYIASAPTWHQLKVRSKNFTTRQNFPIITNDRGWVA